MFCTVEQFLARTQLSTLRDIFDLSEDAPVDNTKISNALEDATGELQALLDQIPVGKQPNASAKLGHCRKVALYNLHSAYKPSKENEQIRNGYTDTLAFYNNLITASSPSGGTSGGDDDSVGMGCAPSRVFTSDRFRGFGDG